MKPLVVIAGLASAALAAGLMWLLVPPTPRLAGRLRPYISVGVTTGSTAPSTALGRIFGPIVRRVAESVGRALDPSGDDLLALRLRRSGLYGGMGDAERVSAFRLRQLGSIAAWGASAVVLGLAANLSSGAVVGLAAVGGVAGGGRVRGRVDRAVEQRRLLMRIEIYSIDQLLALRVRAGGGVMQAVSRIVEKGRGVVVEELAEATRLHRAGMSLSEAFGRMADVTADAACARTYRLLAVADERGVDLAAGLLALAEDVRENRREAMKRAATKRRAAMLIPTIALLAPTLLLFVAAPLPYMLTGWR